MDDKQKNLLEAALFMSHNPLSNEHLAEILKATPGEIPGMIEKLRDEYTTRGIEILQSPAGWMMHVKTELIEKVAHLSPYSDLPDGMLKSLALIVYKHPTTQSYLVKAQGNKVYNYIKKLEERGLIKTQKKGRTKEIFVTQDFENYFGATLGDIKRKVEEQVELSKKTKKQK
ncbi:MAG: SMC-Scp complex subunit ScpB [Candidatus Aenigmatarchaeota archaeon]